MTVGAARPLTEHECAVLDLLLSADVVGASALREQARSAVVVGGCGCGCPSLALKVGEAAERVALPSRLYEVEAVVSPVCDEPPGEVILFVDEGRLSYLEYVYYDDTAPSEWPSMARLCLADRASRH